MPTHPVLLVGPAEAFLVVVKRAVEVKLVHLIFAVQEHSPAAAIRLHVAPHLHRPAARAPAEQRGGLC